MSAADRQAFDDWLWELPQADLDVLDVASLTVRAVDAAIEVPQLTFRTVIAATDDPFAALRDGAGNSASRATARGGFVRKKHAQGDYVVGLWPTAVAGVCHLVGSVPVTDTRWRSVEDTWLARAAPRLAPVILTKPDFEAIGDALSEHGTVEVSRLAARVIDDHSSYSRGWQDNVSRRPTHRRALAETEDMMVRTMMLSIGDRLSVHLRRHAGATFYRGSYQLFCDVVLRRLTTAAAARRDLLTDKQRQPAEPVTETLVMQLPDAALSTPEDRTLLLDSVARIRSVQVAVYHRNPYMHFVVTDYLDGSNFDVFVSDEDRITLMPGYHASVGSLARITDVMGDVFGMIEIESERADALIPDAEIFGTT